MDPQKRAALQRAAKAAARQGKTDVQKEFNRRRAIINAEAAKSQKSGDEMWAQAGGSHLGCVPVIIGLLILAGVGWFIATSTGLMPQFSGKGPVDASGAVADGPFASPGNIEQGQQIVAAAKRFDNEPYRDGGGHSETYEFGAGLDNTGLIIQAVKSATGTFDNRTAADFRSSRHWKTIKVEATRAGDIVYTLGTNHPDSPDDQFAIVTANNDGQLAVIEAVAGQANRSDQIRQVGQQPYNQYHGALRFVG